jgi:hypothetical protein
MGNKSIEPIEVTNAIWKTAKRLEKGVDTITSKAKEYAYAEKNYRIALRKEIVKLRTDKMPVTLIADIARGSDDVAELKFKRDLAEQCFKASRDMLNALSTEVSSLQSILKVQARIE